MSAKAFEIASCEVCGGYALEPVLKLGNHPMCDDLVPVNCDRICQEFPISILYCQHCFTAHQQYQVPKENLFPQTYHYRSRFTADVLNGMRSLVIQCEGLLGSLKDKMVLDIGCNDGSLLSFFRERGAKTCGVEPTGACIDARDHGHVAYNSFLEPSLASRIVTEHGYPDVIVFTNVFAHIEDLGNVLASLRLLITINTSIVIENHYLGAVLDGNQFDTFYHEHPRTYSLTSFDYIAKSLGLSISYVEFPSRYGGNIRVFLKPPDVEHDSHVLKEVHAVMKSENRFFGQFDKMNKSIERWRLSKRKQIEHLVKMHGPLAAKAFPGRAAVLVKLLDLDIDLISSVYEKPGSMKIGHYLPGTRIPIVSDEELFAVGDLSAPLLNLAWHIGGEIRSYMSQHGYLGEIIDVLGEKDCA